MKYLINTYGIPSDKYEVVHEDEYGYLVNHPSYNPPGAYRFWVAKNCSKTPFREYKEPRRIEGWVNVYEHVDTKELIFGAVTNKTFSELAKLHGYKQPKIGTLRIEWVEGQNPQ